MGRVSNALTSTCWLSPRTRRYRPSGASPPTRNRASSMATSPTFHAGLWTRVVWHNRDVE